MTDFKALGGSHQLIRGINDWNNLLDHGLEKSFSYIIRKNGLYYEAIKGGSPSLAGTVVYGGVTNHGGVDGGDCDKVIQAVIDLCELDPPKTIFLKGDGVDWDTDVSITVEESDIHIFGDNVLINYSGNVQAFILGTASARKNNIGLQGIRIEGTVLGTVGVELLECDNVVLQNVGVAGFTSGAGIKVNGGATWASVNNIYGSVVGNCLYGIQFSNDNHGNLVFGGYLWRGAVGVGSKGIYLDSLDSDTVLVVGTYVEMFARGIDVSGKENTFIATKIESCTDGIIINALGFNNCFLNVIFATCGSNYTDNGATNSNAMLTTDYGFIIPKLHRLQAVNNTNIDIVLDGTDGSLGLRFFDEGLALIGFLNSDGGLTLASGLHIQTGGINFDNSSFIRMNAGTDLDIQMGDNAGINNIDFVDSDDVVQARVDSDGRVMAGGGFDATYSGIQFHNAGTLKDARNGVDGLLGGVPRVMEVLLSGVSYYFKVYPTKT